MLVPYRSPPRAPLRLVSFLLSWLSFVAWAGSANAEAAIAYATAFSGLGHVPQSERLSDALSSASQLVALKDRKPPDLLALRRRADADVVRLKTVLESDGYYDAQVAATIDRSKSPILVTIAVDPGQRYTLGTVRLVTSQGRAVPDASALSPAVLGLKIGSPAIAAPVVSAETAIVDWYKNRGRPLARIAGRNVTVDSATRTMAIVYTVEPGPVARFGRLEIEGLQRLDRRYVANRAAWSEGAPYDQRQVDKTHDTLVGSGLFGEVEIAPVPPVAADGTIPIRIHAVERASHTVTAGAAYNTSEGIAAEASWEDRNLFGYAQDLKVTALGGQEHNLLQALYRQPDFGTVGQDLVTKLSLDNELVAAFRSVEEAASLGLERRLDPGLSVGLSGLAQHARINEIVDTRTYTLVGLPATLHLDRSDDLLNPTQGYRADILATPYLRALGSDLTYGQLQLSGTQYDALDEAKDYVLAWRAVWGATAGASLDAIPKDHRFFAGGGASVRGFGYQRAGPRDRYYNSTGGRSLLETSAELRIRITQTIGLVPFLDAAEVTPKEVPDFVSKVYAGAGIGVRYYTAIGPLRLDLAAPLDPRSRGDAPVEFYVSLGQAF